MRVLHLGKYLPPHAGGIERFLAELLTAQRGLGVRGAALVHAEGGRETAGCRRQFDALAVRAPVWRRLAFTPVSPTWPCRLNRLITRWRPDILHLHLPNPSAFWALALPAARRLPWVVHWHADVPFDALDRRLRLLYRGYRPLETAVLRAAASVIATSEAYAAGSRTLAPWRDKLHAIPLGLPDAPAATPSPGLWPRPAGLRVLFVGRFSYYKGLRHLIEAMAGVESASLVLVGTGDALAETRQQASRLGLDARVHFAGHLDDRRLANAYAAADVLCLPSIERSEAFGLVLLEAMRAGVASVATRVPGSGMTEVLDDGRAGVLVEPGDSQALAQALRHLADDPDQRRRLARAGRERFDRYYRIDRVAAMLAAHYQELTGA